MISLILLMIVTLYITFYAQSFQTYIRTVENYRIFDERQIERQMYELQQNENQDLVKHPNLQVP